MMKFGALVNVRHLAEVIASKPHNVRVLDASFFLPKAGQNARENYIKNHIPGALFFDIDKCVRPSSYKRMLPYARDFEQYAGSLGIDNRTHVIIYNNHPDYALYSAPRAWWTFRVFGHDLVSVLADGFKAWEDAGYEVASGEERVASRKFTATYRPFLVKSFEEVLANIEKADFQLVDARSEGRFNGTAIDADKDTKPGHIPGSINIPSKSIQGPYHGPDGKWVEHGSLLPVDKLRKIFKSHSVDLNKPIASTCGSGVTACNLAFAAFLCGKEDISVYDGSWSEWYKRSTPEQRSSCPD